MVTDVIIRADSVSGTSLNRLADWFDDHHPDVPCSVFATRTASEWTADSWTRATNLVKYQDWEIGGHSRKRRILTLFSGDEIRERIKNNVNDIESNMSNEHLEYSVSSFAYPCGDYDQIVISILREIGIDNGLTYPDGYPYQSTTSIPVDGERYRWGLTHNGYFDVDVWNKRFDHVHDQNGLYSLCLHPTWWETIEAEKRPSNAVDTIEDIRPFQAKEEPAKLESHLSYIKSKADVNFTTYKGLTE